MQVECGICHQQYDEAARSTHCPHRTFEEELFAANDGIPFDAPVPPHTWPIYGGIARGRGVNALFSEPPQIQSGISELVRQVTEVMEKRTGAMPGPLGSIPIHINPFIPKDEIWMCDSKGTIHKIINIGNAGDILDGATLCVGECR